MKDKHSKYSDKITDEKLTDLYSQINGSSDDFDVDLVEEKRLLFDKIYQRENAAPKKRYVTKRIYKYAAVAVLVLATATFYFKDTLITKQNNKTPSVVNNTIKVGTDNAVLTLADGSDVTLKEGQLYETKTAKSSGKDISYTKSENKNSSYNYLTVPRAGKYKITLSDGTAVWLNSESKIKYPTSFVDGSTRIVELLYGEAFFDVSPSTENKGSKFKVINKGQEIEVLGTAFNIRHYKNEIDIVTTLVEGKVSVTNVNLNHTKILLPNTQSILSIDTQELNVLKVNPKNYISWREGIYIFGDNSIKDLTEVLARWYDIDFISKIKRSNIDIEYRGIISRDQKITEILNLLMNADIISNYSINGKTVTIY